MTTEKVAVTVPRALLRRAEQLREATGESRSALISRALRLLVEDSARQERIRGYREAYLRAPETPAEIEEVRRLAIASLASLPAWDDE